MQAELKPTPCLNIAEALISISARHLTKSMDVSSVKQIVLTFVGSSVGAGIVTQLLSSRSQRLLQVRQQAFEVESRKERERHERNLQQERVEYEERIGRLQQEFQVKLQHSLEKFKSDYSGLRSKRLDAYTEIYSVLSDLLEAAGRALARIHSIPADKPTPSYYSELLGAWDRAFQEARNVFNQNAIFFSDESEKVLSDYIALHSETAGEFYMTVVGPLADGEGVKTKDWGKVSAAMRETLKPCLERVLQHLKQEIEPKVREVLETTNEDSAAHVSGA